MTEFSDDPKIVPFRKRGEQAKGPAPLPPAQQSFPIEAPKSAGTGGPIEYYTDTDSDEEFLAYHEAKKFLDQRKKTIIGAITFAKRNAKTSEEKHIIVDPVPQPSSAAGSVISLDNSVFFGLFTAPWESPVHDAQVDALFIWLEKNLKDFDSSIRVMKYQAQKEIGIAWD